MSPLWRDSVVVGLAPDHLSALRLGGKWRTRLLDKYQIPLETEGTADWQQAISAMRALLAIPAWSGGNIDVVLSNHFVRYAVVPGGHGLRATEQNKLVQVIFEKTYGDLSHDWELRTSPAGGDPTLASGVPRRLLDALRSACSGSARLRSIQPGLMSVFNRWRRSIGDATGGLAMVEAGRTTLACIAEGCWKSITSRAGDANALVLLLDEENDLHGRPSGGILWLCDLTGSASLPADSAWSPRVPESGGAGVNGVHGLAAWGVG